MRQNTRQPFSHVRALRARRLRGAPLRCGRAIPARPPCPKRSRKERTRERTAEGRLRLSLWGAMAAVVASSLWLASARSERLRQQDEVCASAQQLLERGKPEAAAALLTRLLREQPRCALAHALLGDVRSAQGRPAEALDNYCAAIDLEPTAAQTYYDLTACALASRRYHVAEEYLLRRLQSAPGDAYARRLLALVYQRQRRFGKALEQIEWVSRLIRSDAAVAPDCITRARQHLLRQMEQIGG